MSNQPRDTFDKFWPALFLLWAIQALITFVILARLPSDIERRVLGIYSAPRLAELAITGLVAITFLVLTIIGQKTPDRIHKITRFSSMPGWKEFLFLLGISMPLLSQASLVVLRALAQNPDSFHFAGYANRLAPFLSLISLTGLELGLWLILLNKDNLDALLKAKQSAFRRLLIVWGMLGALSVFVIAVGPEIKTVNMGFLGGPTVPLLEWQILLAWALSTAVMLCGSQRALPLRHIDIWIAGGIWIVASILWLSQPINPGYSATLPSAPNFEIYPFSDALLYAQNAQTILAGKGMAGEQFPARPLYIVFLAALHALAGQDYSQVIALQTLVLAAFPSILYLLGKEISGRPLGIAIALLATLRDITTNVAAPFTVTVTYSKLFLSEIPVALLLSLFALLCIKWLKDIWTAHTLPLIAGGVLGLAILIRTQSAVALLPVFLIGLTVRKYHWRKYLSQFAIFLLGVILSLSPWLWRNWQLTGGLVIDNPLSQMNVLAGRYAGYGEGTIIPYLPGENKGQYSTRMLKIALESAQNNPGRIISAISSHFFYNEIDNLLVFPIRKALPDLQDLLWPTTNFWEDWNTSTALAKPFLLSLYTLLFGVGITAVWQKTRWLGLLPLGINLGYNAWTAMFMSSGMRFLVPVDWVFYTYEMSGLTTITMFLFSTLGTFHLKPAIATREMHPKTASRRPTLKWSHILAILIILMAGSSIPLSERVVPDSYPPESQSEMWAQFAKKPLVRSIGINANRVDSFAADENIIIIKGRALYPRYFAAGEGLPQTAKTGYGPNERARLVFYLVGQKTGLVIFELPTTPAFFPNAADVTIVTRSGFYFDPQIILVSKNGREEIYVSPALTKSTVQNSQEIAPPRP